MAYLIAQATQQDAFTGARRATSGNYALAGAPRLIAPVLGGTPRLVAPTLGKAPDNKETKPRPKGSAWTKANADAAMLMRAVPNLVGSIQALPLPPDFKTQLLNNPLDVLLDIFDPIEDFLAEFIVDYRRANAKIFGGTALQQTWTNLFTGKKYTIDFRRDRPGDEKLDASTRNAVKRLRIVSLFGYMSMTDPLFAPALILAIFGKAGETAAKTFTDLTGRTGHSGFFGRSAGQVALHEIPASVPAGTTIYSHREQSADFLRDCGWGMDRTSTDRTPVEIWSFSVVHKYGGSGKIDDPTGGSGGFGNEAEKYLRKYVKGGIVFSAAPGRNTSTITSNGQYQIGTINGEGYVFVKGSDGNHYKFKMPNTGIGYWTARGMEDPGLFDSEQTKNNKLKKRRDHLRTWFNGVVDSVSKRMPKIEGAKGRTRYYYKVGDPRDTGTKIGNYESDTIGIGITGAEEAAAASVVVEGGKDTVVVAGTTAPAWLGPLLDLLSTLMDVGLKVTEAMPQGEDTEATPPPPESATNNTTFFLMGGLVLAAALIFAVRK